MVTPVPFDAPATPVAVCVQLKVAPAGVLVKFNAVELPEQIDVDPTMVTTGVGFTTRFNNGVDTGPVQPAIIVLWTRIGKVPAAEGVSTMVAAFVAEGFKPAVANVP